ncbi:DUF1611 domain-containing protein [Limnovirga soli]|uniref:DUF1611 domain-containing protein n=1 Tax=Limnovirga soli TaxID=2656915 RepID=A0A8J8FF56_9BACT|nr:DUF1611 domain-containing protein [Limnovirga soli]NNV55673.1 DUF1611 domain-containing protein [Limnovirga soli]
MINHILPKAIVLTDGILHESDAKTAHGLIRATDRYTIAAVIDERHAGKDAGEVLDGIHRNIPIYASVQEALAQINDISYAIIGIATVGGILPDRFIPIIETCIKAGMHIVNGLHDYLSEKPALAAQALANGVELIDVRKPKQRKDLHFWTGDIFTVKAPIIAVIGTDCALGKRTTCRLLQQACAAHNINAQMIYTGQTGWLQGGRYGFIFDSTLNDFISGELEHAIVSCYRETNAAVIFIEGQAALRNPSGPCGSEMLVSGNARRVILVHAPKREHYDHIPAWGAIPSVASEIALIRQYGAEVIALALNTEHCTTEEAIAFQLQYEKELGIPVLLPLQQGVDKLIPFIQTII